MRNRLIFLLAGLIVGCAASQATSFEQLSAEINAVVQPQMPLSQAQSALNKLNFQCMQGTSLDKNQQGVVECTRNKGGFLYRCIHRVWLEAVSNDGVVANIEIHQPLCAGL